MLCQNRHLCFGLILFKAWAAYRTKCNLKSNFIWFHSDIRIGVNLILWDNAYLSGLKYMHQLYENGKMKQKEELMAKFDISLMQLNSLASTIPDHLKVMEMQINGHPSANTAYWQLNSEANLLRKYRIGKIS